MKICEGIVILVLAVTVGAQTSPHKSSKNYVEVVVTDNGATSELMPIPIGMSTNLSSATFSAKYFGPQSDSDISVMLFLKGTKYRYSTGETFAVRLYADGVPLNQEKSRLIDSVDKNPGEEVLHFFITSEEIAWLAAASKLSIKTYNTDTNSEYDTLVFTPTALSEFKKFAKSVYLIRTMK